MNRVAPYLAEEFGFDYPWTNPGCRMALAIMLLVIAFYFLDRMDRR